MLNLKRFNLRRNVILGISLCLSACFSVQSFADTPITGLPAVGTMTIGDVSFDSHTTAVGDHFFENMKHLTCFQTSDCAFRLRSGGTPFDALLWTFIDMNGLALGTDNALFDRSLPAGADAHGIAIIATSSLPASFNLFENRLASNLKIGVWAPYSPSITLLIILISFAVAARFKSLQHLSG